MKKLIIIFFALMAFTGTLYAAGALTSGDQLIRGSKTFEHDATFNQNITVRGALLGMSQYGNIYYVHSGTGIDSRRQGKTYLAPYASINYAISGATADVGDIIYVMPGHSVAITTAGEIDINVAGLSIIGLGRGSNKPTITYGVDGSVTIAADNVTIKNFRFSPDDDDIVVALDIDSGVDNTRILNCEFGFPVETTDEFLISIQNNDASNMTEIRGNHFFAGAQGAACAIALTDDTDATVIADNWFNGVNSDAVIFGTSTASTNLLIMDNVMFNTGGNPTFVLAGSSTGMLINNYFLVNTSTAAADMDIGNVLNIKNWYIADSTVGSDDGAYTRDGPGTVNVTADDS